MEQFLGIEDPAERTRRARVDQGGSYVTSIVARRPVTGGKVEATTSVNSPVKLTIGEIGRKEIGEDMIGEQEVGRSRGEIGRNTPKCNKEIFRTRSEVLQARARTTPSICVSQDRNLRRPRSHFDQWDLRSFRGYCRGYGYRVGSPRSNTSSKQRSPT